MKKPFDTNFHQVMTAVCYDLMNQYAPTLIYTQSDEINMIFFPRTAEIKIDGEVETRFIEPIFNGNVQEIVSCFSAYASVRLNYWLDETFCKEYQKDQLRENTITEDKKSGVEARKYDEKTYEKILDMTHFFAGRVFQLPDADEVYNHILWRQTDCIRNSVAAYAKQFYDDKELDGNSTTQKILMIRRAHGEWADSHVAFRQGMFFKKARVEVEGTMRSRIMSFTIDLTLLSPAQKSNFLVSLQKHQLVSEDFNTLQSSSSKSSM
jgi:hypothetical protein